MLFSSMKKGTDLVFIIEENFRTSLSIRKIKINVRTLSILTYHISKPDRFIQNAIQTLLGSILACFCKC